MVFQTNSINRVTIASNGNVGIGTTSPGAKLDVAGAVRGAAKTDSASLADALPNPVNVPYGFNAAYSSDGGGMFAWYQGESDHTDLAIWYGDDGNVDLRFLSGTWDGTYQDLTDVMILTHAGNVGIGTTDPNTKLDIRDTSPVGIKLWHTGDSHNDPAQIIMDESTANAGKLWIVPGDDFDAGVTNDWLVIGDYSTGVKRFYFRGDGNAYADAGWNTFSPYLSMTFIKEGLNKEDFELGEIVVETEKGAIQSAKPYDPKLLGVVVPQEGFISTPKELKDELMKGDKVIEDFNVVPVAHLGKVEVKVSTINGPIEVGDAITSSEIPGVGMKATKPGKVVGMALEKFDSNNGEACPDYPEYKCGKITVFVNPHWWGSSFLTDADGTLSIDERGNVGIGTTDPGSYRLYLSGGEAYCDQTTCWNDASDIALKENIRDLDYGLKEILALKPTRFLFKPTGEEGIGFVAQEVEKIIPEVVSGEEGHKGISYGGLTPVLVKAIQEQQKQIEELKTKLTQLTVEQDPNTGKIIPQQQTQTDIRGQLLSLGLVVNENGVLEVRRLKTDELCVENVCVNEEQLKELLEKAGISTTQNSNLKSQNHSLKVKSEELNKNQELNNNQEPSTNNQESVLEEESNINNQTQGQQVPENQEQNTHQEESLEEGQEEGQQEKEQGNELQDESAQENQTQEENQIENNQNQEEVSQDQTQQEIQQQDQDQSQNQQPEIQDQQEDQQQSEQNN